MSGYFTTSRQNTNKISAAQDTLPRVGQGGGRRRRPAGLFFRGETDGNLLAIDAKTGHELWRSKNRVGARRRSMWFNGEEYVAIAAGGNQIASSVQMAMHVCGCSQLRRQLVRCAASVPPTLRADGAGRGRVRHDQDRRQPVSLCLFGGPQRIKAGDAVTFTNVGGCPAHARRREKGNWERRIGERQSRPVTSRSPARLFTICAPHPWEYGQGHSRINSSGRKGIVKLKCIRAKNESGEGRAIRLRRPHSALVRRLGSEMSSVDRETDGVEG